MNYIGTRGEAACAASQALINGIAGSGGLYVPEYFPDFSGLVDNIQAMNYNELAAEILKPFFSDFTEDEMRTCVNSAYDGKFLSKAITPLAQAGDCYFLELYHGRTLAFKDVALSILPHLLALAAKKTGLTKKLLILTATSGDTGKAALEGFAGVDGIKIAVFYPEDGVSLIQKLQMITQEGDNTLAVGIKGNFDDAQTGVKQLFTNSNARDKIYEAGYVLTSANSINIGRLLPQVVYYFSAYAQMLNKGAIKRGEKVNFTVPTGNFGNILAGYYAYKMGLPVNKLICASNENRILTDFFATGAYNANREFYCTISPSMDILISSNLERLLFDLSNAANVQRAMKCLSDNKSYNFIYKTDAIAGVHASSSEALDAIGKLYARGYLIDTHTAVGYAAYEKYLSDTGDVTKNIILSTASPYKFPKDVLRGIGRSGDSGDIADFEAVRLLSKYSNTQPPAAIAGLENKAIRHTTVCDINGMYDAVLNFLR